MTIRYICKVYRSDICAYYTYVYGSLDLGTLSMSAYILFAIKVNFCSIGYKPPMYMYTYYTYTCIYIHILHLCSGERLQMYTCIYVYEYE